MGPPLDDAAMFKMDHAIAAVLRSFVARVSMKNERCLWWAGIIPSAC